MPMINNFEQTISSYSNDETCTKKVMRKLKRHLHCLAKHDPDVALSNSPSKVLFVANSGVLCGVSPEDLEKIFTRFDNSCSFVVYLTRRPYTFVEFSTSSKAQEALTKLQGKVPDTLKPDALPFYLAFVNKVPAPVTSSATCYPPGLRVLKNFVNGSEETMLMEYLQICLGSKQKLKSRSVMHFGYKFDYNKNEASTPTELPIPLCCDVIIDRMMENHIFKERPDQLTVNIYEPGGGIPCHVDVHSSFGDTIVALSLMSDIVMEFRDAANTTTLVKALLPRFSLLVMQGESRYRWKHGISKRKHDVDPETHRLIKRGLRVSFTFRKVAFQKCSCPFPEYCDWDRNGAMRIPEDDKHGKCIESEYVALVYDSIAEHFDITRRSQWNAVKEFLNSLCPGSILYDVGCGNGRDLIPVGNLIKIGCDLSEKLCLIAHKKGGQVLRADILALPFKAESADAIICVAVIHHMSTNGRRIAAMREILRCLRSGGRACITVWSFEQKLGNSASEYLKMRSNKRDVQSNRRDSGGRLRIHEGRNFTQQDMLVPYQNTDKKQFLRYYHVFVSGELEKLISDVGTCVIEKSVYEEGNWIAVIRKL